MRLRLPTIGHPLVHRLHPEWRTDGVPSDEHVLRRHWLQAVPVQNDRRMLWSMLLLLPLHCTFDHANLSVPQEGPPVRYEPFAEPLDERDERERSVDFLEGRIPNLDVMASAGALLHLHLPSCLFDAP